MKTNHWIVAFFGVLLLALAGCGGDQKPPEFFQVNGIRVDLPDLQQAFASGTPEQRTSLSEVQQGIRYQDFVKAMMALETLSQDASLTEPQKQLASKVMEQMKQVLAKAPAPTQ
jgi:hypothetical protein